MSWDRENHIDGNTIESKAVAMNSLLDISATQVFVDVHAAGVEIPDRLRTRQVDRFNLSRLYEHAPEITPLGVRAVLSFNGSNETCFFPWASMFAMWAHMEPKQIYVWAQDVPTPKGVDMLPAPSEPPIAEVAEVEKWPALRLVSGDD